ncbi:MAG: acyl--CoA ligase, partial [Acidimicrobiia bacterium]|nr:acyl--CoA ligase [Acidimicrobiia bacterium]
MRVDFNVQDYLDRGAFVYPDRIAIVDEPDAPGSLGRITYAEFDARARGFAARLDALGLDVGERIAIVSPNSARFLIAIFGVSGSGRVLVPINFRLKP